MTEHGRVPPVAVRFAGSWYAAIGGALLLFEVGIYPFALPAPSFASVTLATVVTVALFFGGLVLHEFGHALTARAFGEHVNDITMRGVGGITHRSADHPTPKEECVVVLTGPVVTIVFGGALLLAAALMSDRAVRLTLAWSALMQLSAALVNLLPLGTLDGGRAQRALALITGRQVAAVLAWSFCLLLAIALLLVIGWARTL